MWCTRLLGGGEAESGGKGNDEGAAPELSTPLDVLARVASLEKLSTEQLWICVSCDVYACDACASVRNLEALTKNPNRIMALPSLPPPMFRVTEEE